MVDYKKQGKRNRAAGLRFEKKVRADLESKGWIVSKWQNNVGFGKVDSTIGKIKVFQFGRLIPAKMGKYRTNQGGFPDFICFKMAEGCDYDRDDYSLYKVIGVEVKSNGYLSKEEKEKCKWLLENKVFSKILIAYKDYPEENINLPKKKRKKRKVITYKEFENVI